MNLRNPVDKVDADELIKNLKFNNNEYLTLYLKEVWAFYELPGIISERLFAILDKNHNYYIDSDEFTEGMKTLLAENFDKSSKFIFDFYDFDRDGHITREDIRVVLSYVSLCKNTNPINTYNFNSSVSGAYNNNLMLSGSFESFSIPTYRDRVECQEELYVILEKFFNEREFIDYKRFLFNIENICSEVYFYILAFLLENKPFSKHNLIQYERQMSLSNANINDSKNNLNPFLEQTESAIEKKPNLIATPNFRSKLSPSITLSKSPIVKNLNREGPCEKFDLKMNFTDINNNIDIQNKINPWKFIEDDNCALNTSLKFMQNKISNPLKPNILMTIENNFKRNLVGNNMNNIEIDIDQNTKIYDFKKNASSLKKQFESCIPIKTGAYENKNDSQKKFANKVKSNSFIFSGNEPALFTQNTNNFAFLNQVGINKPNSFLNGIDLNPTTNRKHYSIQQNCNKILNLNFLDNSKNSDLMSGNEHVKMNTSRGVQPKNLMSFLNSNGANTNNKGSPKNFSSQPDIQDINMSIDEESDSGDEQKIIKVQGYLYKLTDLNKLKKLWFNLIQKDLYYFKNENETQHKGMHNLTGVFVKEEKIQIIAGNPYFCFGIVYPKKTRYYFTEKEEDYKMWISSIKKVIGYSDINDIYEIKEKLGNGKFGLVRLGVHKHSGQQVAIKIMSKKEMNNEDLELVKTEIEILKICQHPHIIKLLDVIENVDFIFIIMECCSGNDLFSYLQKRGFKIPESRAAKIIHKLATAVFYIHSYGIIHRDLKPENILMTDNSDDADIRLLDFGLSKIIGPTELCREPYGTLSYVAPEVLTEKPYSKAVDLWSIGVTTYLLLCSRLPFDDPKSEREIARQTVNDPIPKHNNWKNISEEAKDFIENLLQKDPIKRFNIKQVLEHPWIQNNTRNELPEIRRKSNAIKTFSFELYSSCDNFIIN